MRNKFRLFLIVALFISMLCGCVVPPNSGTKMPSSTVAVVSTKPLPSETPTSSLIPTSIPQQTVLQNDVVLQEGSPFPKFQLPALPSAELEDNRMGAFAGGLTGGGWKPGEPWDYQWMADQITSRGLKRFRVSIDNLDADSPDLDWSIPQYTIDPSHDALITLLSQQGLNMTYVLTFWDKDTYPVGKNAPCPRFKDQQEIDRYLDFVRFFVNHFKDRIRNYEIWNEPTIKTCPQWIEADDYINLVRQAAPVIREAYPDARIVVGATNYLSEPDSQAFLFKILISDIMPLVDIISWHPMYGTSPEFDPDYYYRYPSIVQKIKDAAAAHGFKGSYEADELTWFTIDGLNSDGWSKQYYDISAAKYMARGILLHLGMDVTAGIGSALLFDSNWVAIPSTINYLSTLMTGAKTINLPVEIDSGEDKIAVFTFHASNGDILIAFWKDDIAAGDFSGTNAVLRLPGQTAQHVTGIDVINGFQQELTADVENGGVVVQNIQVKDYPIIIRFSK
ncbi:MAG: hypothetical protein AB9891_00445 [Anaerolineaceae bacterium]